MNFIAVSAPVAPVETGGLLSCAGNAGMCWHSYHCGRDEYLQSSMAGLSVTKLDDETLSRLRIRAAKHEVSMEEEARRILRDAVNAPDRLGDLALRIFGPQHGIDLQLPDRTPHEPLDLTE